MGMFLPDFTTSLVLGAVSAQSGSLPWYFTRTCAISAYIVLAAMVSLGLLRVFARRAGDHLTWMVDEAHQWLGTVFATLVVLHMLALLVDPYLPFSIQNLFIPTDEPYRPLAVTFGVLAFWCLVVVLGTSWIRRHLPYGFWRAFHYLSFVLFVLVTLHGVLAGSDSGSAWMLVVYLGASAIVALLTVARFLPKSLLASPERS
jgi:sulfoxide reductase heme-binding subunit YedZ